MWAPLSANQIPQFLFTTGNEIYLEWKKSQVFPMLFPAIFVQPKERRKREETIQLRKAFHLKPFNVKHQNNWTIKNRQGVV